MLISLKTLICEMEDEELQLFLSSFSCRQDEDIEHFLHNRAVEFEKLAKSRTYLICDRDELLKKNISEITVYGYISLAIKILTVPETVSNRVRKNIDGFSAKIRGEQIRDFPCYLIGQLSRNSNVGRADLKGAELITFAQDVISTAVDAVGGRYMMIECRDNEKLIRFYRNNGFDEIARVPDNEQPMVQMIKRIY